MRLTEEQILAGLLHPEEFVRTAVLRYFTEAYSPDPRVMAAASEAIARYGHTEAFNTLYHLRQVAQSPASIAWCVSEIAAQAGPSEYRNALGSIICTADPDLTAPHAADLLAIPAFDNTYGYDFRAGQEYHGWSVDDLWQSVDALCTEAANDDDGLNFPWEEADALIVELGWRGVGASAARLDLVGKKPTDDDRFQQWQRPLLVNLVSHLRYAPAIPALITYLLEGKGELLAEDCIQALRRIGGDAVVQALVAAYPGTNTFFRFCACDVLNTIHTDAALAACRELLAVEQDPSVRSFLGLALVSHFSPDANELALPHCRAEPDQRHEALLELVASCRLCEQQFPEIDAWEAELKAQQQAIREFQLPPARSLPSPYAPPERSYPAPAPIQHTEPRVGRNDPCPCGSGKKFKKCCWK